VFSAATAFSIAVIGLSAESAHGVLKRERRMAATAPVSAEDVAALRKQIQEHQEDCENLYNRKLLLHAELTEAKHAISILHASK
jgi:hypothetical protein